MAAMEHLLVKRCVCTTFPACSLCSRSSLALYMLCWPSFPPASTTALPPPPCLHRPGCSSPPHLLPDAMANNMLCLPQCLLSPPPLFSQGNPPHLTPNQPNLTGTVGRLCILEANDPLQAQGPSMCVPT